MLKFKQVPRTILVTCISCLNERINNCVCIESECRGIVCTSERHGTVCSRVDSGRHGLECSSVENERHGIVFPC